MKNIFVKSLFILPLTLSLNAIEINKSKTFTVSSEQKSLQTNFKLTMTEQKSSKIENSFKKAIEISNESKICTGGSYRLYPNYRYENSKRVDDGYRGEISFNCDFRDKNIYQTLITNIKNIEDIKLTQNQIQIIPQNKNLELEKLSFHYAKEYIEVLHNHFVNCTLENINFSKYKQSSPTPYYATKSMSMSENISSAVTAPINRSLEQSLNVNYKFSCQTIR